MGVPTPQFSASSDGRVMLWHGHEPPVFVDAETARSALGVTNKNYIINGSMMVSQENGTSAGTATGYYPVDQFFISFSNAGTQTAQQVASVTPAGSPNRLRVTATVADASVGAGDSLVIATRIEGLRLVDLRLGGAAAKTITIQFGLKSPAGTYCIALRNAAADRCYVAEYVVAPGEANTDVVKSVTIALDQSGTWAVDNTLGVQIAWTLMAGTSNQGTANVWGATDIKGTANQFNFMGTAGNVYELFDVDMVVGATAPEHQVQVYCETLQACQRHFWKCSSQIIDTGSASQTTIFPTTMRANPTITGGGAGFTVAALTPSSAQLFQTGRNYQDIKYSARL